MYELDTGVCVYGNRDGAQSNGAVEPMGSGFLWGIGDRRMPHHEAHNEVKQSQEDSKQKTSNRSCTGVLHPLVHASLLVSLSTRGFLSASNSVSVSWLCAKVLTCDMIKVFGNFT